MSNDDQPARATGAIERALSVIEKLVAARQPMSMTSIAEAANLDTSSAHRILKLLTEKQYVLRDPRSKRYLPGPKSLYPLGLFHPLNVLRRDAVPTMQALAEESGQTVALIAFIYGERIVLEVVHGAKRLTPFYETHMQRPLHSSASGKALLLALSPEQRASVLGAPPYARFTASTITAADRLEVELAEAERCGYTRSTEEDFAGISAVCAPIRSAPGTILGCFGLFGLSADLPPERLTTMGERVRDAALLFTYMSTSLEAVEAILS